MLLTFCFFGVAKSSALEKLSKKRPQPNIFNYYLILSVLGQSAIHIGCLMFIRQKAIESSVELDEKIDLDSKFQPNLLNSAVYLVQLTMNIATFAINYQGEPFRESLYNNKAMFSSLRTVSAIAIVAALEIFPPLNDWMQLVPFPPHFKLLLIATMLFDFGGAWLWEFGCNALFSDNKPRPELALE
jgi:cation-transporting ATPase 13A1